MKKRKILIMLIISLLLTSVFPVLQGCGKNRKDDYSDWVKVVFELEGGVYQNCERPVTRYYHFREDTENLLTDLSSLSGKEITRSGFILEGWYRNREEKNGEVTYSGKWDFTRDKVGPGGVTLYARWQEAIRYVYRYEVCYRDESGNVQVLGTYTVNAGEKFDDSSRYANGYSGHTSLGTYRDEDGNVWDLNTGHPGGEGDLTVKIFPDYIEGDYAIIRTVSDLNTNKNRNLYLMNDIDFGGKNFGGFGIYTGTIRGNGYSIRNFTLTYPNGKNDLITDPDISEEGGLLCIGLFRELKGATLCNVSFTDFKVKITSGVPTLKNVIFAPLAVKCSDVSLTDVKVSLRYEIGSFPSTFNQEENLTVVTDRFYYLYQPEAPDPITGIALEVLPTNGG